MVMRRVLWIVAMAALYEWFAVSGTRDEALMALAVGCVAAFALARSSRETVPLDAIDFRGFSALITRIPIAACRETVDALGPVLWRALVRGEREPGRWISLTYLAESERTASEGDTRRALVIFGSGLTPNACPLDIDDENGRFYLHQLVHRRESAAGDPEYPI